jgi:hypothetical protein
MERDYRDTICNWKPLTRTVYEVWDWIGDVKGTYDTESEALEHLAKLRAEAGDTFGGITKRSIPNT